MKSIWTYIALVGAIIVSLAAGILQATGASVSIAWDPPILSNNVVGYKIYHGLASRSYTGPQVDVGNVCTGNVNNLDPTKTYYFAITVYNAATNESEYSAELVWDNVFPVVVGLQSFYSVAGLPGVATMPSITNALTITDDFSSPSEMHVAQSPEVGTVLADGVTVATVTVTDEAGNMTAIETRILCTPFPPRNLRFSDGTLGVSRVTRSTGREGVVVTD